MTQRGIGVVCTVRTCAAECVQIKSIFSWCGIFNAVRNHALTFNSIRFEQSIVERNEHFRKKKSIKIAQRKMERKTTTNYHVVLLITTRNTGCVCACACHITHHRISIEPNRIYLPNICVAKCVRHPNRYDVI